MEILKYLENLDKNKIEGHIKALNRISSSFKALGDEVNTSRKEMMCRNVSTECMEIADIFKKILEKI